MKVRLIANLIILLFLLNISLPTISFAENISVPPAGSNWLSTLNYYRLSSGLPAVAEDPKLTDGAQKHVNYLINTDKSLNTGQYASLHTENPASPYYTKEGTTFGAGNIAWGSAKNFNSIDNWMTAPFHAIGMLRENLKTVGFGTGVVGPNGYYPGLQVANLAVIAGIDYKTNRTKNIFFPGNDSVTYLNSFYGENPEPRETCGDDYKNYRGLPLFASLLNAPKSDLAATLTAPDGTVLSSSTDLCVVHELNFKSSDSVYGPAGKSIIAGDHLVLLIPRNPLIPGKYQVNIKQSNQPEINWSFKYVNSPPVTNFTENQDASGFSWLEPTSTEYNKVIKYEIYLKFWPLAIVDKKETTNLQFKFTDFQAPKTNDFYQYCVKPIYELPIEAQDTCASKAFQSENEISTLYPNGNSIIYSNQFVRVFIQDYRANISVTTTGTSKCTSTWTGRYFKILANRIGTCQVNISAGETIDYLPLNKTLKFNFIQPTKPKKKK